MPHAFAIDHDNRIITRRVWGDFTDTDAIDARQEFLAMPESQTYNELYDFLEVRQYMVTADTIRRLAEESVADEPPDFAGKKVAIVADGDLAYGMLRMYQGHHSDSKEQIMFFQEVSSAMEWLLAGNEPIADQS